jgi:hypothetical protein
MYTAILIALFLTILRVTKATVVDDWPFPQYVNYSPADADCVEYIIPAILSARIFKFNAPQWNNDYDLIDYVTLSASRKHPGSSLQSLTSPFDFDGNFTISATYCSPKTKEWKGSVLVATHGLGFNRE